MPFLTEYMYQNLAMSVDKEAPESIHLCDFPEVDEACIDEQLEHDVAMTRAIVSLGRAARNKVNIKVRQPLSEMVINLPKEHHALSKDDQTIILEELNIRQITTAGHNVLDDFITYHALPQFEKLGPKFGTLSNKVAQWIQSLSPDDIQQLMRAGSLKNEFNGTTIEITQDDVAIQQKEKPGWSVVTEDEIGVGINTELTKELKNEGLVRELIHKIQLMRKEADFNLDDRIKIYYKTSPQLKKAIAENVDYLKNETLSIEVLEGAAEADTHALLNVNGIDAEVFLQRVKKS
jgi:isoleucyl-tRNA synthetase